MTQKEIDKARKELNDKYYGDALRLPKNLKQPITMLDAIKFEELSCREMINSIMIYGGTCEEGTYEYNRYIKPYIEGNQWHKTVLAKGHVQKLIEEQRADIAKAQIGFAGYDSEGCSYKYCKFADEI